MQLPTTSGARFHVWVTPRASRTAFLGYNETKGFQFSIAAPPENGKANTELLRFLKKEHKIRCTVRNGHTSRKKLLEVT